MVLGALSSGVQSSCGGLTMHASFVYWCHLQVSSVVQSYAACHLAASAHAMHSVLLAIHLPFTCHSQCVASHCVASHSVLQSQQACVQYSR